MDAPSVHLAIDHIARTGVVPSVLSESAGIIIPLTCFMQHIKIRNLIEVTNPAAAPQHLLQFPSAPLNGLLTLYESALTPILQLASPASNLATERTTLSRTLQILIFAPLPLLSQASHWETTTANFAEARRQLSAMMVAQPTRARQVMLQAARLFNTLRNATPLSHIDPFCLLISVLYIHAFITGVVYTSEQTSGEVYRVDQDLEESKVRDWIEGRGDVPQLHVSGIGILHTERSSTRLFKEAARIFSVSAGRSCLAAGLSGILSAQAAGQIPSLSPSDDVLG